MTKSGVMPVASMALQIERNSVRAPTQSLKPTGFPPDSRLQRRDELHEFQRVRKAV